MQAARSWLATRSAAPIAAPCDGKKDKEKMAKEREKFREGAARLHKIKPEVADDVFDTLEKFAGYGVSTGRTRRPMRGSVIRRLF